MMIRVSNEAGSVCDHHTDDGVTVRRLKEVFEVVSDIVFAEHRCRYFSADIIRIQLGIQR